MDITAELDCGEFLALLESAKTHLYDLGEPLARVGGYLRGRAKARCDQGGPGWAPLAASTLARKLTAQQFGFFARFGKRGRSVADTALTLERKQSSAIDRAGRAKTGKARARALDAAQELGANLAELAESFKGMRADFSRRLKVSDADSLIDLAMAEQDRRKRHGAALKAARALPLASGERRVSLTVSKKATELSPATTRKFSIIANPSKERQRLRRQGATRARRDIRSTQVLGALRDAFKLAVFRSAVAVFWAAKWAKIHHTGGTAGHGAQIKERRALLIEPEDVRMAAGIFRSFMMEPFGG